MFKRLIGTGLVALLYAGSAHAANCSAYTYTLTNGTTADANQVMSNFNNILNCGNNNLAPLASPRFTGNVGIGTTTPGAALFVFGFGSGATVATSGTTDSTMNLRAGRGNVSIDMGLVDSGVGYLQNRSISNFATNYSIALNPNGGNVGVNTLAPGLSFTVNGTAGGTSAWQVISDARLKTNIQPISNALPIVLRLNPVRYDWREPSERSVGKTLNLAVGERQIGFIAQEVEKVIPEAVAKPGKGADATYGLKQENLIPLLVAAIKEQQAEIEQLRATVAALTPATQH